MKNLAKSILVAMQSIGYLQKDKTVGTGGSTYKGLSDQKATQGIREALMGAGIIALPTIVEPTANCKVSLFESVDNYGKPVMKLAVFTEVRITYTLIHTESGESATIQAIGQGIDTGTYADKAAGKAMTYAKKNALLNALLISSGLDADDFHSDDLPTLPPPPKKEPTPTPPLKKEPTLQEAIQSGVAWCYKMLPSANDDRITKITLCKSVAEIKAIMAEIQAEARLIKKADEHFSNAPA